MSKKPNEDAYSREETTARADAALKRMFVTPHETHKPIGKRKQSSKRTPTTKSKKGKK